MNNRIVNRDTSKISIIGRLKIGEKDAVKGYPKSVDYFIPTGKFSDNFTEQYGKKPNKILIFFPSQDVLIQQYVLYCDGKRFGVSDGLTVDVIRDGEHEITVCNSHEDAILFMNNYAEKLNRKQKSKPEWKLTVSIKFLLAELRNIMGLWQFETAGKASMVDQITNSFDNACNMFGTIIGVPFWLSVEKIKHLSAKDNNAKIFPVVTLSPAIGFGQLIELKTGAKSVPEMIDNTINMLSPNKQVKAIAETKKTLSEKEINSVHEKIENGKGTVQAAIDFYKSKGYDFNEFVFTNPREQFVQLLADSMSDVNDIELILVSLESKGYVVNDYIINKLNETIENENN